jgi:hypothetical protein
MAGLAMLADLAVIGGIGLAAQQAVTAIWNENTKDDETSCEAPIESPSPPAPGMDPEDGDPKRYGGLVEGKPSVPEGSVRISRESQRVKSIEFRDFLKEQGISQRGWKYRMEEWKTPEGEVIKRHYWYQKKTGMSFYHLR